MLDQRLLAIIGTFSDPGQRTKAAKKLAEALGADDLIIFSKDPILEVMLPAPGFPQTLHNGADWRKFIQRCAGEQYQSSDLISPFTKQASSTIGMEATDGSILVLLGKKPDIVLALEVVALVPLIVAALSTERVSSIVKGELEAESIYSERAKVLASALDQTRRTLESELRKSTNILNSITDAFIALDSKWKFIEMNNQAESLIGKKRNEVMGKIIWDVYPEAVNSNYYKNYHEALTTQKPVFFEEYFPTTKSWYEVRAYPSREGLAIYFNDITEKVKVIEELRQSQEWFQTTLRSIGDGVIAINTDRTVSFLNSVAEELTGWKLSEAKGMPMDEVFKIINEKTREPAKNPVDRVLKEGKMVGMANHTALIARSGTEYVIEDSAAPIRNSEGTIIGVVLVFRDVTSDYAHKIKLEETYSELRSERSRLEAVLQQMPEGVIIADSKGKLLLRNAQLGLMLGGFLPCDNIEDYGQYKGFRSDGTAYLPHEWPLARSLTSGEIVYGEEIEFERIDGGRSIQSISSAPILDEHGKIVAGVVIHHDITKPKLVEAELRYQSYLTKTIADNAASALFMMDRDGKPTYMNPAAQHITGYQSLDEIKDKPLHYAVHWKKPDGSHYPMEECPIDNAQTELKKVQNQEEVFCTKDGRLFPVSFSVSPLEKSGKVIGSVLEFRDISIQKQTEAHLQTAVSELDKSLETLITINRVGQRITAELNLETLVQQVTDDATRLTGAQFGAFFYNSIDPQGRTLLLNVVSGVPKEKFSSFPNPRATEIFHPTFLAAGTVRSADITKDPRYDQNSPYNDLPFGHLPVKSYLAVSVVSRTGEVIGGLFFGHEKVGVFSQQSEKIAEGLAAQAAVAMDNARLYKSVQESVKARDEFLSIASHELKTPLTSLKLQTQIRNRKLSKGEIDSFNEKTLSQMFETDARQIDRLARLIDDMLDISRISIGKLALQPETFDMCALIKDVVDRYSGQIQDYGSEVKVSCSKEVVGTWDRFRIEQVITNLLTNALRYGNYLPIEIKTYIIERFAFIEVVDQGIGIAKESQSRIFERFERAISATEISGLGLGLFIVKQILEMHSGSIKVESDVGKGSRFIVQLPLEQNYSDE